MSIGIDSLEIAIQAEASTAASQIDTLYSKLGSLAKALNGTAGGYRKMATEVGRVTAAVKALASVNIPNFSKLVAQLETLSNINLQGLATKKVSIDVEVNAPKSASQIQWAIQKAADDVKIDSDKIAESLINQYSLTGKAKTAMKSAVAEMTKELSASFDGKNFDLGRIFDSGLYDKIKDIINEHGKISAELVGDQARISEALNQYTGFVMNKTDISKIKSVISEITDPSVAENVGRAIVSSQPQQQNTEQD